MTNLILVLHDIRSIHNVGSLLRTAECFGVSSVLFTGYTPYPKLPDDIRLPHVYQKTTRQIHKTALGAESMLEMSQHEDVFKLIEELKKNNFDLVGLEQSTNSVSLKNYKTPDKVALFIGREVEGLDPQILNKLDCIVEIEQRGKKESLNVVQASAICLFHMLML